MYHVTLRMEPGNSCATRLTDKSVFDISTFSAH